MRFISLRLLLLTLGSAVLQAIPFAIAGPVPTWRRAFCWFAMTPLIAALLAKRRGRPPLKPVRTALLGYCCGILWYLINCSWIYQTMYLYGGMSKPVAAGILVLFCLYLGLYHALFGWLVGMVRRGTGRTSALIAVPFLWVAVELARARITGFPWDLLGYTQVDNLFLTKLAPYGGVMAMSFVIASISALFAAAWLNSTARIKVGLAVGGLVLAAGLQYGSEYNAPRDPSGSVATLLQENLAVGTADHDAEVLPDAEKYKQFSELSASPKAPVSDGGTTISWIPIPRIIRQDFTIWPEAPAHFATSDPIFMAQASSVARYDRTALIAGSVGVDTDTKTADGYREFGSAAVFDMDGAYLGRYDKIHRVPWGEYVPYEKVFSFAGKLVSGVGRMDAGTEHKVFNANNHNFSVFICYESIFGDEVRQFVKNGAEVLINISDDGWYGDTGAPWQHLDMARMRAIENRRWLLRDTNTGITTAIDPHGRGIFTTPRHVRAAYAFPFAYFRGITVYTRYGDVFAWLCVVASVALVVYGIMQRRKKVH